MEEEQNLIDGNKPTSKSPQEKVHLSIKYSFIQGNGHSLQASYPETALGISEKTTMKNQIF